jgi:hypothetical protein
MLAAEGRDELVGFTVCGFSRDADANPGAGEVWSLFVATRTEEAWAHLVEVRYRRKVEA